MENYIRIGDYEIYFDKSDNYRMATVFKNEPYIQHILTVVKKASEIFVRENNEIGFKKFADISPENADFTHEYHILEEYNYV